MDVNDHERLLKIVAHSTVTIGSNISVKWSLACISAVLFSSDDKRSLAYISAVLFSSDDKQSLAYISVVLFSSDDKGSLAYISVAGLSLLSSVSKHNMWSYYDWVVVVFRQ